MSKVQQLSDLDLKVQRCMACFNTRLAHCKLLGLGTPLGFISKQEMLSGLFSGIGKGSVTPAMAVLYFASSSVSIACLSCL